jgi:hypothetical protein
VIGVQPSPLLGQPAPVSFAGPGTFLRATAPHAFDADRQRSNQDTGAAERQSHEGHEPERGGLLLLLVRGGHFMLP